MIIKWCARKTRAIDIESSAAEGAVAKALDKYWEAVGANPHALPGDVVERWDGYFRWTEHGVGDEPFGPGGTVE